MTISIRPAGDEVRDRVKAKPAPVQVVIQMITVKLNIDADATMDTPEEIASWTQAGLETWDAMFAEALGQASSICESVYASMIIERLRSEPGSVWGKILRGNAS